MPHVKPIDVTDKDFDSEVIQSSIPVLVDFWAPWCGPCKMAAPILDKIAHDYDGKVKVCKVNVDEERGEASKYGVRSIPSLFLFSEGKVVDQIIGVTTNYEADIKDKLSSYL